eukprot:CCRYP_015777-RA/>CCRYP_015777-RA protein AED:0.09 eAED:0.09 QI:598/1/1/1/0.5/0.33/3/153/144
MWLLLAHPTRIPLALATPAANPRSAAKCVITMLPTLDYRNLVGVPRGKDSMYAKLLLEASVKIGDKLDFAVGKGNDGDVPKVSFIMDSKEFPFFVAEQYHQFHDGFIWGEDYPLSYNSLASKFAKTEDFGWCSNGLVRIGIGGL